MDCVTRVDGGATTDDAVDAAWRPVSEADPPPDLPIARGEPVARHTSFRVGGPADYLARPADVDGLRRAVAWARENNLLVTIIGGGSNLICSDRGVRGLALAYRAERVPLEVEEDDGFVRVTAPAQRMLSNVARFCCEQGWAGLDWAVGLPGTVGGAVANNAGAHGTEMIDHLEDVTVVGPEGTLVTHDRAWLQARYRHTILRSGDAAERPIGTVIVAATLRLPRGDRERLLALAAEHAAWRKEHQPRKPCAGSIFKNPPGAWAGLLVEEAGLKGYQVGGAQISELHGNFIVNAGGATAADVLTLIRHVQQAVQATHGIALETEVEFIGDWSNEITG
jgi:UDP-N-acetylmuramate dehydrogenase